MKGDRLIDADSYGDPYALEQYRLTGLSHSGG